VADDALDEASEATKAGPQAICRAGSADTSNVATVNLLLLYLKILLGDVASATTADVVAHATSNTLLASLGSIVLLIEGQAGLGDFNGVCVAGAAAARVEAAGSGRVASDRLQVRGGRNTAGGGSPRSTEEVASAAAASVSVAVLGHCGVRLSDGVRDLQHFGGWCKYIRGSGEGVDGRGVVIVGRVQISKSQRAR